MISVQVLANSVLLRAFEEYTLITPIKLLKLIYYIYRHYLEINNQFLFEEDIPLVLFDVYDKFKSFGSSSIYLFAKDDNGQVFVVGDNKINNSIDYVWNKYKNI